MSYRFLKIYVDDATDLRLAFISKERFTAVDDLAGAAVSEAALEYFRHRKDDPAGRLALSQNGGGK